MKFQMNLFPFGEVSAGHNEPYNAKLASNEKVRRVFSGLHP